MHKFDVNDDEVDGGNGEFVVGLDYVYDDDHDAIMMYQCAVT